MIKDHEVLEPTISNTSEDFLDKIFPGRVEGKIQNHLYEGCPDGEPVQIIYTALDMKGEIIKGTITAQVEQVVKKNKQLAMMGTGPKFKEYKPYRNTNVINTRYINQDGFNFYDTIDLY